MTVAALASTIIYVEDGVTTAFTAPFRYNDPSDLQVNRLSLDGGVVVPLTYGVDFIATPGDTDDGGEVTPVVVSTGTKLQIKRATPRRQQSVYTTGDRFPALLTEGTFDIAMLIDQEQDDHLNDVDNRALKLPIGEIAQVLPPKTQRIGGNKVVGPDPTSGVIGILDGADFKGDPGGSPFTVGLRSVVPTLRIPAGYNTIITDGNAVQGVGGARYVFDPLFNAAAYPEACAIDAGGRIFRLPTDGEVNLRWFGAKGDGVTPDDAPIAAALKFCIAYSLTLYVPTGSYIVSTNGLFSPAISRFGFKIRGDNLYHSVFQFDASIANNGTDYYFFKPGNSTATAVTLENVGFYGCAQLATPPDNVHFMQTSGANTQEYVFNQVSGSYFNNTFVLGGSNLASEFTFYKCDFSFSKGIFHNNQNGQSFNHGFYGCSLNLTGAGFRVGFGGGTTMMINCNVICLPPTIVQDTYFADAVSGVGQGGDPYLTVYNSRFEFHSSKTKLARTNIAISTTIVFGDCLFEGQAAIDNWLSIASYSRVDLTRCTLYPFSPGNYLGVTMTAGGAIGARQNGTLLMDGCKLPGDFLAQVTVGGGRVVSLNASSLDTAAELPGGMTAYPGHCLDFALGTPPPGNRRRYSFAYDVLAFAGSMPKSGPAYTDDHVLYSPISKDLKGMTLREVHIASGGGGGAPGTPTQFTVGSSDHATVYGQTPSTAANAGASYHGRDLSTAGEGFALNTAALAEIHLWSTAALAASPASGSARVVLEN